MARRRWAEPGLEAARPFAHWLHRTIELCAGGTCAPACAPAADITDLGARRTARQRPPRRSARPRRLMPRRRRAAPPPARGAPRAGDPRRRVRRPSQRPQALLAARPRGRRRTPAPRPRQGRHAGALGPRRQRPRGARAAGLTPPAASEQRSSPRAMYQRRRLAAG